MSKQLLSRHPMVQKMTSLHVGIDSKRCRILYCFHEKDLPDTHDPLHLRRKEILMDISFKLHYNIDTELRPLEHTLKELYLHNPIRELDEPHEYSSIKDILLLAGKRSGEFLSQNLEEADFFQKGFDCQIYQHLRYLPCNWHTHTFFEVVCLLKGSCTNYILNHELDMKPGDICIIAPDTRHAISAFSDDSIILNILLRTSTFETAFYGSMSDSDILSDFFMRTLYHSPSHPYLLFHTEGDLVIQQQICQIFRESKEQQSYKNRMLNSLISTFFIQLLRRHGTHVVVPDISDQKEENENLLFILKYMQSHYSTLTLKELSSFFNYSERQLQRIIKASTGLSFSDNIQKLKMRQAARLLSDSSRSDIRMPEISDESSKNTITQRL